MMHQQQALDIQLTAPLPPIPAAAAELVRLGIVPLRVAYQGKNPTATAWQKTALPAAADVPLQFAGQCSLGALLGTASNGLVDVDLDWPETERLAPHLLPIPTWTFGRPDDAGQFHLRHVLFRCAGAATASFDAPAALSPSAKGRRIIELLATGKQVVVPPSIHKETGQPLEWQNAPTNTALLELAADTLHRQVARIAGAALLVRHWPEFEGSRHDLAAALTGACWHARWTRDDIESTLAALFTVADDPERKDRGRAVLDTLNAAESGQAVTGWPKCAELLGPPIAGCLQPWWNLGTSNAADVLTFNGQTAQQAAQQPLPSNSDDISAGLLFGGKTAQQATGQTTGTASTAWAAGMDWPELLEFESSRDDYTGTAAPGAAYPTNALGPILGPAVHALSERQQVPHALAAQSCLSAAAAVVQERFDVLCDGRTIPLSLWLVLVAVPGERKTTTDSQAFRLIHVRLREAELRYQVALDAWNASKGDRETDPGPKPRKPSWLLTDATTEGLLKTLDRHWPALTLTNSDAATWVSGYSMREGRDSATGATLSNLWSGAYQATARASLDAPATLYGRRLSLSLMLQPAVAADLFESKTLSGQGFLSRCLPAFPPSTIGSRPYRSHTADTRLDGFEKALDTLLTKQSDVNLITGELRPQPLPLDDAALKAWIPVHDRFEAGLIREYRDITEVANKAPEQVLRLAGVQAALEQSTQVQQAHIERATQLVDWHLGEWQRMAVRLVAHRKDVALPAQLLDWMQQRRATTDQTVFSLRETYKDGPRIVRGQSQLARELMAELLRRGYVRVHGKDYELRPDDV